MLDNYTVPRETPAYRKESRQPIRLFYGHEGSYVVYRAVKLMKTGIGAALGIDYGKIRHAGETLIVMRRNGGAWESVRAVKPESAWHEAIKAMAKAS